MFFKKIILIGIDGGTFDLILPKNNDCLPTFRKIISEGSSRNLVSTLPPKSPPAWASLMTGVNPGKHGIFDFFKLRGNRLIPVSALDIKSDTLWEILSRENKKIIVVNMPLTFPPKNINGIIIPGILSPPKFKTHPSSFKQVLLKEFPNYRIYNKIRYDDGVEKLYLADVYELLRLRGEVILYLLENYEWNLFAGVFFYIDQLQHYFWKYSDPNHPLYVPNNKYRNAILNGYKIIDYYLKRILNYVDDDTLLIVVSDHGFGPLYKEIYINNIFLKLGVLRKRKTRKNPLTQEKILRIINTNKVIRIVANLLAYTKVGQLATKHLPRSSSGDLFLDLKNSYAISLGYGIHILNRRFRKKITNILINILQKIKDPETNESIFRKFLRREDIYWGKYTRYAPDLIYIPEEWKYSPPAPTYDFIGNDIICLPKNKRSGEHKPLGIFISYGEGIKKGKRLQCCSVMDIAPTILYSLGLKVPGFMDGYILKDIFDI